MSGARDGSDLRVRENNRASCVVVASAAMEPNSRAAASSNARHPAGEILLECTLRFDAVSVPALAFRKELDAVKNLGQQ